MQTSHPLVPSNAQPAQIVFGDYDNDGDMDVYISRNVGQKGIFKHQGTHTGTYAHITGHANIAADHAKAQAAWADYDGDNDLDLLVIGSSGTFLYRNQGNCH